jgi:PadR family transcriptional regulator, regulatory protein PadR
MGEFEQLVLLAILRLADHAYGMEIRAEIEKQTRREVSYGAVYTTLDRLDRKGFVSSELGASTPERGGRARKYFRVEPAGQAALRATRNALSVMWDGVAI